MCSQLCSRRPRKRRRRSMLRSVLQPRRKKAVAELSSTTDVTPHHASAATADEPVPSSRAASSAKLPDPSAGCSARCASTFDKAVQGIRKQAVQGIPINKPSKASAATADEPVPSSPTASAAKLPDSSAGALAKGDGSPRKGAVRCGA